MTHQTTTTATTTALVGLFIMEVLSGLSRGAYLVCIGWTTLIVTGDVARVGQVFIVAMLTMLLGGPLVGVVVDRYDRRAQVILAHLGLAGLMAGLGAFWVTAGTPHVGWLFLCVVAASLLRMLHNSAHDALIQGAARKHTLVATVARFRTVHLAMTALGTVAAGSAIERLSPSHGFYLSALASGLIFLPMLMVRLPSPRRAGVAATGFLTDLRDGVTIFRTNAAVRKLALLAGIALPVGQLSNAVLSSLVRDDLAKGSEAFGFVDAAWPVGGMAAAAFLSLGFTRASGRNMEFIFAVLAGLSTAALSFGQSALTLALLHGAMGMSVWLCRIVIDARILEVAASDQVGRSKAGVEMAFSFTALVMCLSPTLVTLKSSAGYFLFWGLLVVLASALLWLRSGQKRKGVAG